MKNSNGIRKLLAWALCLAMLAGLTALPILAAPDEGDAPAAPAVDASTQEEAPVREEAPAPAPDETPAEVPNEGPVEAAPADTPAEAPTGDNDEPADGPDEEAPADEAPAEEPAEDANAQTPADAPAEDEDEQSPADEPSVAEPDEETPADEPTDAQAPADGEPAGEDGEPARPVTSPISRPGTAPVAASPADEADENKDEDEEAAEAAGFAIDWAGEDVRDNGWGGRVGAVQVDEGCYLYFELNDDTWSNLALYAVAPPDRDYWSAAVSFAFYNDDPTCLKDSKHGDAVWDGGVEVRTYTSGGKRRAEAFVPNALLPDEAFAFVSNEARFPMDAASSQEEAVYNGIVIDGQFQDWAALPRYDIDDFHDGEDVDQFSIVWDGAYIYLYFVEYGVDQGWARSGDWRGIVASGPNSNGQFEFLTDLGRRLLIQPVEDPKDVPAVAGIDGAMAAANNVNYNEAPHMWEIAIPASALPEYVESFSFGYYLAEPAITGVTDLQGGQGVDPFGQNVVIDGKYDDWVGYPHEIIEYDTPGNPFHVPDGEGALWSDDGWLYGHVSTQHPDHLAERGSEYLAAIDIVFNGNGDPENDDAYDFKEYPRLGNFYPRILAIDASGGVADFYETLNEGHSLDNGTYTFYIFDTRTDPIKQFGHTDEDGVWHDADAAALIENAFGTMKITVNGVKDEMEFCLDLEKVAAYIGDDADNFRSIDAHFGRIGPQWIRTAGTSTGPVLLALLAAGAVAAPMGAAELRRRQARRRAERDGADEGGEK